MDAQQDIQTDGITSSSCGRRKGINGRRAVSATSTLSPALGATPEMTIGASPSATSAGTPCGACKFLRRKCINGCVFAPYFSSDQGAARFAAVHKVFGASNVSKLLLRIPTIRRQDAVVTISYEAQARLSDPVHGCVSTIFSLQQQVASLRAELVMVQNQLMNSRFAIANVLQSTQQAQQIAAAYSNNSSTATSNRFMSMETGSFGSDFEGLAGENALQFSREDEDEQECGTRMSCFYR